MASCVRAPQEWIAAAQGGTHAEGGEGAEHEPEVEEEHDQRARLRPHGRAERARLTPQHAQAGGAAAMRDARRACPRCASSTAAGACMKVEEVSQPLVTEKTHLPRRRGRCGRTGAGGVR